MHPKISNAALEAYSYCATKFHLSLHGARGKKSDYELMELEARIRTKRDVVGSFVEKDAQISGPALTRSAVELASRPIFAGVYEDEEFHLEIDGVVRTADPKGRGTNNVVPMLFLGSRNVRKPQRRTLEVYGLVLMRLLDDKVRSGLVWSGRNHSIKILLRPDGIEFSKWLAGLLLARTAASPPRLLLNDHCQICEFRTRCRKQAIDEGNLTLLRGMSATEIAKYNAKGLFNLTQLSYTFRARRKSKRATQRTGPHYFSLQALAIREKKVFVHGSLDLNIDDRPRLYVDIEGTPDKRSNYLIGVLTVYRGREEFKSYWANNDAEAISIFEEFLTSTANLSDCAVIHYGNYEDVAFRLARKLLKPDFIPLLDKISERSTNLLALIRTRVYFPTYSNSLKEIGEYVGARWSDPYASGIQSLVWREKWLRSGRPPWKDRLLRYNQDDCYALKQVFEFVEEIAKSPNGEGADAKQALVFTDSLPKAERRSLFSNLEFALPEFKRISKCAYFDYQRDKVVARSEQARERNRRFSRKRARLTLKITKIHKILATRCPTCRSRRIRTVRTISRNVIDIKFSSTGVKRWVVRYVGDQYKCEKCKTLFIPKEFPVVTSQFGWGLVCWCMYQYFVSGQNMSRIAAGLKHLFQLPVPQPSVHRFKEHASAYYRSHCRLLFDELMRSPFLHIDETHIKLRQEKGYVWVLTNGDIAYYFYRGSREGGFLSELLKNFSGVVISDFFTAYDALLLRQQRCLIHLMRDFNEELLKAPYDEQLRLFSRRFSEILASIIDTIDSHGLKRKYLLKHKPSATEFLEWVGGSQFDSKASLRLQARINKYRDMMFTFLEFDNVSWNNNNAELAIKSFARHRRFSDGMYTARSIQDYLVILTLAQTCEYRGKSFLQFMLKSTEGVLTVVPRARDLQAAVCAPLPGYLSEKRGESVISPVSVDL